MISEEDTDAMVEEFKRLCTTDETIYLRNGSTNRINGIIAMTFSCERLETFATTGSEDTLQAVACV